MAAAKKATKARTSARPVKQAAAKKVAKKAAPKKRVNVAAAKRARKQPTPAQSKAAAKAAQQAQDADAIGGKGLSAHQRQIRDTAVIARLATGVTQVMVAEEFKITERQVRRIETERAKMPSGLDERPMDILEGLMRAYRADIADFEAMAYLYRNSFPSAAVGAKKAARETRREYVEMLFALGKLPTNLELFKSEAAMMRYAEQMIDVLEALVRGDTSPEDALSFFRSLIPDRPAELAP